MTTEQLDQRLSEIVTHAKLPDEDGNYTVYTISLELFSRQQLKLLVSDCIDAVVPRPDPQLARDQAWREAIQANKRNLLGEK